MRHLSGSSRWWSTASCVCFLACVMVMLAAERVYAQSVPAEPPTGVKAAGSSANLQPYYKLFQKYQKVSTASKSELRADVAPAVITVLPRALLQAHGYRTVGEALASVPGLFVLDDLVTSNVSVRGINLGVDNWSRGLKFMINGTAMTYEATGGALVGPEFIPIQVVESIEVIRGPASALYGANAFLGVVNVVTVRPSADTHAQAAGEVGALRNHLSYGGAADAHVTSADGSAYFIAAASAAKEDRSGLAAGAHTPARLRGQVSRGDLSSPVSLFGRGVTTLGILGELSVQLVYQQLDAFNEFGDIGTLTHQTRLAWSNAVGRIEHRIGFAGQRLELHSFVGGMRGSELPWQRLDVGIPSYVLVRERQNTAIVGGTELLLKFDQYTGLVGVDVLGETNVGDAVFQQQRQVPGARYGNRTLVGPGSSFFFTDLAAYAQASARIVDVIGLWGGLRYDDYSRWRGNLSWRAAATYSASEDLHFKILYGTSFVPPSPSQLTGAQLGLGGITGNSALQPQTANTLEASTAWTLTDLLSLQLNGFWTSIARRVEYLQLVSGQTAQNSSSSNTFGGELAADFQYRPFVASANVSYSYTLVDVPLSAPSWFNYVYGDQRADPTLMPAFPAWIGHVSAGTLLPQYHVQATLLLNLVGARSASVANAKIAQASYVLPGYITLDAHVRSIDLRINDQVSCELSLHGNNLLGQAYYEPGDLGTDIPARGRSVYFKAAFLM